MNEYGLGLDNFILNSLEGDDFILTQEANNSIDRKGDMSSVVLYEVGLDAHI